LRIGAALAALLGAVFIQIGTNLVNDVEDFERGADDAERLGPRRATQTGDLSAATVRKAALLSFAAAAACGIYLTALAGWPILVLGLLSIASGIAYTAGPWPLAYIGLGDLFVFVFFGLAAVAGTYYVQVGALGALPLLAAVPVGCLATAILVVNNTRDVRTDARAGKRTLAVRFGAAAARREYALLVAVAFAAVPILAWRVGGGAALLPLVLLPHALRLVRRLCAAQSGAEFNALLRDTALLQLFHALLLAAGVSLCASPS
jgi:1,4-dihydroxy-2-naphthoate octaprenyltransferase